MGSEEGERGRREKGKKGGREGREGKEGKIPLELIKLSTRHQVECLEMVSERNV